MRSVLFAYSILLVVMVTSDAMAKEKLQQQQQQSSDESSSLQNDTDIANITDAASNSTDVSDITDASNITDEDANLPSNDVAKQPTGESRSQDKVHEALECSITAEQYDNLNEKLMELSMQLELLQTSVDRLDVSGTTRKVTSGKSCEQLLQWNNLPVYFCNKSLH